MSTSSPPPVPARTDDGDGSSQRWAAIIVASSAGVLVLGFTCFVAALVRRYYLRRRRVHVAGYPDDDDLEEAAALVGVHPRPLGMGRGVAWGETSGGQAMAHLHLYEQFRVVQRHPPFDPRGRVEADVLAVVTDMVGAIVGANPVPPPVPPRQLPPLPPSPVPAAHLGLYHHPDSECPYPRRRQPSSPSPSLGWWHHHPHPHPLHAVPSPSSPPGRDGGAHVMAGDAPLTLPERLGMMPSPTRGSTGWTRQSPPLALPERDREREPDDGAAVRLVRARSEAHRKQLEGLRAIKSRLIERTKQIYGDEQVSELSTVERAVNKLLRVSNKQDVAGSLLPAPPPPPVTDERQQRGSCRAGDTAGTWLTRGEEEEVDAVLDGVVGGIVKERITALLETQQQQRRGGAAVGLGAGRVAPRSSSSSTTVPSHSPGASRTFHGGETAATGTKNTTDRRDMPDSSHTRLPLRDIAEDGARERLEASAMRISQEREGDGTREDEGEDEEDEGGVSYWPAAAAAAAGLAPTRPSPSTSSDAVRSMSAETIAGMLANLPSEAAGRPRRATKGTKISKKEKGSKKKKHPAVEPEGDSQP